MTVERFGRSHAHRDAARRCGEQREPIVKAHYFQTDGTNGDTVGVGLPSKQGDDRPDATQTASEDAGFDDHSIERNLLYGDTARKCCAEVMKYYVHDGSKQGICTLAFCILFHEEGNI